MRLDRIAAGIGARVLTHSGRATRVELSRAYAGATISELLDHAGATTLLVTALAGRQLADLAALLDVEAICVVGAASIPPALLEAANDAGKVLLEVPGDLAAACRRLEDCGLTIERGGGLAA